MGIWVRKVTMVCSNRRRRAILVRPLLTFLSVGSHKAPPPSKGLPEESIRVRMVGGHTRLPNPIELRSASEHVPYRASSLQVRLASIVSMLESKRGLVPRNLQKQRKLIVVGRCSFDSLLIMLIEESLPLESC